MQLRYRIGLEDYREAQKLMGWVNQPKPRRWLVWTIVGIFLIAPILYCWWQAPGAAQDRAFNLVFVGLIVLFGLVYVLRWGCSRCVDRAYARDSSMQREFTLDLTEHLILADDSDGASSKLPWSHYNSFAEGEKVFIMVTPSRTYTIIPKSVMSAEEKDALRTLLTKHLQAK